MGIEACWFCNLFLTKESSTIPYSLLSKSSAAAACNTFSTEILFSAIIKKQFNTFIYFMNQLNATPLIEFGSIVNQTVFSASMDKVRKR